MINISPGEDINSHNTTTFSKFTFIIVDDIVQSPVVASIYIKNIEFRGEGLVIIDL